MRTKEQYFKDEREKEKKEAEERKLKWRNDIAIEASVWDYKELLEEYIKCRLARISYCPGISAGMLWDFCKEECRFCGLEYVNGHEDCCDDCWDKNKTKTLEELE